jgi:hypothetical protein
LVGRRVGLASAGDAARGEIVDPVCEPAQALNVIEIPRARRRSVGRALQRLQQEDRHLLPCHRIVRAVEPAAAASGDTLAQRTPCPSASRPSRRGVPRWRRATRPERPRPNDHGVAGRTDIGDRSAVLVARGRRVDNELGTEDGSLSASERGEDESGRAGPGTWSS